MKLGELIAILKTCKQEAAISIQAPIRLVPKGVDSYRGYYDQLAINVVHVDSWDDNTTVAAFLKKLEEADGATFTGYKGGEFKMTMAMLGDTVVAFVMPFKADALPEETPSEGEER